MKKLDIIENYSNIPIMEHQTIKIWKSTLKVLRRIYAETGEPMVKILDRIVNREWEAIEKRRDNE